MHLSVYRQCEIFYYAFIFGLALGVYYDFYRLLRYLGFKSRAAVIAQDIVFMTTSAVLCFLFAQVTVNGHLRAFIMIAHLFGVISYRYSIGLLSGFIFKVISYLLNFISKIFKNTIGLILKTGCNVVDKLLRFFRKIFDSFAKKTQKLKKVETN